VGEYTWSVQDKMYQMLHITKKTEKNTR